MGGQRSIAVVGGGFGGVGALVMLKRAGYDPALASSIFLTTVTDVMGFFTFLGLATLVLLR